jgi:ATPase subunit of ABC transporter with duplicated ATPase domains
LEAKLKEIETKKVAEIPKNPGQHMEMMKELENKMEEAQKARQESIEKLEEAVEKGEEVEKSESLYLRLKELHKRYEKEKEKETKKAFEAFERISHLDNEMFEAEEFLRELKKEGKYDPKALKLKKQNLSLLETKMK